MKNNTIISIFAAALLAMAIPANSQSKADNLHLTIDWQLNAPINNDFADKISGWGMNFEGTYDITPHWTLGGFAAFHTNHKYVGRSLLAISPTETLLTDRQQSAFQLPFGATAAYNIVGKGHFRPYVGVKTGAMFARNTTYYNVYGAYDKSWGYYVSPEIGIRIFPAKFNHFGFHVAAYYNYATNKTEYLGGNTDGMSNVGIRVGLFF